MKDWIADYSIKMVDGEIRESRTTVQAASIEEAMVKVNRFLCDVERGSTEVDDTALWGVCIAADPDMENPDDPVAVF